tara:strand:- start:352 stop:588 length:237 start_codon:yes stop_codon:yes gene_type:complete
MINKVRDFLQFEILFVVETLLSLLLLLTVTEVLLGPLVVSPEFYLIELVESLNNSTGLLILFVIIGAYGWALEDNKNV